MNENLFQAMNVICQIIARFCELTWKWMWQEEDKAYKGFIVLVDNWRCCIHGDGDFLHMKNHQLASLYRSLYLRSSLSFYRWCSLFITAHHMVRRHLSVMLPFEEDKIDGAQRHKKLMMTDWDILGGSVRVIWATGSVKNQHFHCTISFLEWCCIKH